MFLAALMLLTAWVFVAPEKAAAVSSGTYKYRMAAWHPDANRGMEHDEKTIKIYGRLNGQGGNDYNANLTLSKNALDMDRSSNPTYFPSASGADISGFPVGIQMSAIPSNNGTMDAHLYILLQVYNNETSTWVTVAGSSSSFWTNGSVSCGNHPTGSDIWLSDTSLLPKANKVEFQSSPGGKTIPKTNANGTNGSTTFSDHFETYIKDQYGVKVSSSASGYSRSISSIKIGDTSTDFPGVSIESDSTTTTADKWKTTVTSAAQYESTTEYQRTAKVTVSYTFNSTTKTASKTFTLTDPKYKFTMNGNGSTTNPGYAYVSQSAYQTWYDDNTKPDPTYAEKYYHYLFGSAPWGFRAGYAFGNVYNERNDDNYGWDDSTSWPRTGTRLISSKNMDADTTYYAAWKAKDVNVTFLDNQDRVWATGKGKYDQSISYYFKDGQKTEGGSYTNFATGPEYKTAGNHSLNMVFVGWSVYSAKQYYITDAKTGAQDQKAYYDIEGEDTSATLKGDVVFKPCYLPDADNPVYKYTVTFKNPNGTDSAAQYNYGVDPQVPSNYTITTADADNNSYTYSLYGWSTKAPENGKKYHLVNSGTDLTTHGLPKSDERLGYTDSGEKISTVADLTVRKDVTYYPVIRKEYKEYAVTFSDNDSTRPDETGIPLTTTTLYGHYNDELDVPALPEKYYNGPYSWDVAWNEDPGTTFTANRTYKVVYSHQSAAEYAIRFFDYDGTTQLNEGDDTYYYGDTVDPGDRTRISAPTQTWSDGEYNYTWNGTFLDAENNPVSSPATAPKDYYAQYTRAKLYTVNYYNGTDGQLLESVRVAEGASITPCTATPSKEPDYYSNGYSHSGWTLAEGAPVPENMPGNDLDIYATFEATDVIKYYVKFINNGAVYGNTQELHYGDDITVPANPTRPSDENYDYTFTHWDKTIPETVDESFVIAAGETKTIEYTAEYSIDYHYYSATWYYENGQTVYTSSLHTYNSRLYAPYDHPSEETSALYPSPDQNQAVAFIGWKYVGGAKDGELYKVGDRIIENVSLKAYYEYARNLISVTFKAGDGATFEDGRTTEVTLEVPYGDTLSEVAYPHAVKPSTRDDGETLGEHFTFAAWTLNGEAVDPEETTITENCTFIASFDNQHHTYDYNDPKVTAAPTFWADGTAKVTCSNPDCGVQKTISVDPLSDTVKPTAATFINGKSWRTPQDADFENATPVAPSNFITLAASDTAEEDTNYNAEGKGSGIKTIEYTIAGTPAAAAAIKAGTQTATWKSGYACETDELEKLTVSYGNYTGRIVDVINGFGIADGDSFVILTKVTDKCNNTEIYYTGLLAYDETLPTVEVNSDFRSGNKHCLGVTIVVGDNNEVDKVAVDGEELTAVGGTYTFSDPGIHQVVVSDKAGNETRANFEIVGDHNTKTTKVEPTCVAGGTEREICLLCGTVLSSKQGSDETADNYDPDLAPKGHTWGTLHIAPTCTESGKIKTYCVVCGVLETDPIPDDPDAPATGHTWAAEPYYLKPATCVSTGLEEKICTVCGHIEPEVLVIDPDAHSYHRARTLRPTCTDPGKVYQICKYEECGYENVIEQGWDATLDNYNPDLAPTGHHASGKWVVTKEASCEVAGTQVQYCVNGCIDPNTDEKIIMEQEEIPALGHNYVFDHTVPAGVGVEGYSVYKCTRCEAEENRDYVDALEPCTLRFYIDGALAYTHEGYKGDGLDQTLLPDTAKEDATETYKYVFKGWFDSNNERLTFPYTITESADFHAEYDETFINYTVAFHREDTTVYMQYGYRHNGEEVDFSSYSIAKAQDEQYDYEFLGWTTDSAKIFTPDNDYAGLDSTAIYKDADSKYTINAEEMEDGVKTIDMYPAYKATTRVFTVVWLIDNNSPALDTQTVAYNNAATYSNPDPTKAYDNNAHYVFAGWDKDTTHVKSDMAVYAKFTAVGHLANTEVEDESVPATCTESGKLVTECSCGFKVETVKPALGHDLDGAPFVIVEGQRGQYCKRDGCDAFVVDTTKYTVVFLDYNGSPLKTVAYQLYGADISDKIPTPTREADATNTYTFAGWVDAETNEPVSIDTIKTVTGNATYKATYTETANVYKVFYVDHLDNVLESYTATYDQEEPVYFHGTVPERTDSINSTGHWKFVGWSAGEGPTGSVTNVSSNMRIVAQYEREAHTYTEETHPATCTSNKKITYTCSVCDYSYDTEFFGTKLEHNWVPVGQDGNTTYYVCSNCGAEDSKTTPDTTVIAVIKVVDSDGHPVEGAKVTLIDPDTNAIVGSGYTDSTGTVRITVPSAKNYKIIIESPNGTFTTQEGTVNVGSDGSTSISGVNISAYHCSCACHKDGIWGTIFRFFHKIIKLITGKFQCCNDPDPRYK